MLKYISIICLVSLDSHYLFFLHLAIPRIFPPSLELFQLMVDPKSCLKILYVTPEKLAKSKRFMTKLQSSYKQGLFSNLAIDEVHCCSQWGHDFRPDYKFLGVMKNLFPKVPILGLTATSTSRVTQDCQKLLNLKNCLVFRAEFNSCLLYTSDAADE